MNYTNFLINNIMRAFKFLALITIVIVASAFTMIMSETTYEPYKIGDIVNDFTLMNIDGQKVSLKDYRDEKGVIVVFTCNHCPYSKMYEDRIIALDKTFKSKGFPVLAINPNDPEVSPGDDFESMKKRAQEKGFTFPYLFDENQKVYPKFGATRTPHVFILKNDLGNMKLSYIGAIDNNARAASKVSEHYVEDVVNSLLDGKVPSKTMTKAIGCSIKVAKT